MKAKIIVSVIAVLSVLVILQFIWGGNPDIDDIDARMEKLRKAGNVEALGAETANKDPLTARRAVQTLGYAGRKAVPHIRRAMSDPRPEVRQQAASAYARAADPKKSAPLREIARTDKSPTVRASAVTALGRERIYEEMDTLLDAMDDDDFIVRRRAAESVVQLIGRRYPYKPGAPSAKRKEYIAVIRRFWKATKGHVSNYYDTTRQRSKDADESEDG